jgi:ankyrin repeat protein
MNHQALEDLQFGLRNSDAALVRRALEAGIDPNVAIHSHQTKELLPLHHALRAAGATDDVVAVLLEHGADPCQQHGSMGFPFHAALTAAKKAIALCMLPHVDLLRRDHKGDLNAHLSFKLFDLPMAMQAHFEKNSMPKHPELPRSHLWVAPDSDGLSAIHRLSGAKIAKILFLHPDLGLKEHLDLPDRNGRTPLWHAAMNRRTDICKFLLSIGARTDIKNHDGVEFMDEVQALLKQANFQKLDIEHLIKTLKPFHDAQMAKKAIDEMLCERMVAAKGAHP